LIDEGADHDATHAPGEPFRVCDARSRQFDLLKNGLIEGASREPRVVKLLCELAEAEAFVDWAATVISSARAEITIKEPPHHLIVVSEQTFTYRASTRLRIIRYSC